MRPGGHLASAVILGGAVFAVTRSLELSAGCFAGGFLIDGDHYMDYVVFERQWRHPAPSSFLGYYFKQRYQRMVLPFHSWEMMSLLTILAMAWPRPALVGYLIGAFLHLFLDIVANGEHAVRRPILFYSFIYRAFQGFSPKRMVLPLILAPDAGDLPLKDFFRVLPTVRRQR